MTNRTLKWALALMMLMLPVLAGCSLVFPPDEPPCCIEEEQTPIETLLPVLLDTSGSMLPYVDGYGPALDPWLDKNVKDGSLVLVQVVSSTSLNKCKMIEVEVIAEGANSADRRDDLDKDIRSAKAAVQAQIECGKSMGEQQATDLLGALGDLNNRELPDTIEDVKIAMLSDGLSSSDAWVFDGAFLDSGRDAIEAATKDLADRGLLPMDLPGDDIRLYLYAAGVEAGLTATQAAGLDLAWSSVCDEIGCRFYRGL